MKERILSADLILSFCEYLINEEKSTATVEKYLRDVCAFSVHVEERQVTKETVMEYKQYLQERNHAVRSINSMLASLNSLFGFLGWQDCRVKFLRQQKRVYCPEEKELSKGEYQRLLQAAKVTLISKSFYECFHRP